MARTVNEGFGEFLKRLTPTNVERESGARHRATVKAALEAKLTVNSFFETGSFSNGTGVRGHSDIDVLVNVGNSKPASSYTALTWVKDALAARFPNTSVIVRNPAVVVGFASGYETWEVIPGFMTSRGGKGQYVYDIPGPNTGSAWIDSAPKEHLSYVNSCNASPNKGNAKGLARLIKAWKYYCNVPISSFYLEMRCAQHVSTLETYVHIWDVCQVLESLNSLKLAAMNDPSDATGRIYAYSSDAKATVALSKLNTAASIARKALDAYRADDSATTFYYLDLLFGGHFPAE